MKIAITGKGGVGKTTLAASLALLFAEEGLKVLAVDADPDSNLGASLGISEERLEGLVPIADMKALVEERTGGKPGTYGTFFKMNPRVDDIPDGLSIEHRGVKLLVMGTVKEGGGGCVCPESVMLKALMQHLLLARDEVVILDMEAGIEHLGRGTAGSVDAMIVVLEPGMRSIQTARAIRKLASDISIARLYAVVNKVEDAAEARAVTDKLEGIPVLGTIGFSAAVRASDLQGESAFDVDEGFRAEVKDIRARLEQELGS
ncbi:MAG: ATP-binding protein [Candidatus Geothermincolia bacterium]